MMITYQRRKPFMTTTENTTTITAASHAERVWVRPMPTSIRIADTMQEGAPALLRLSRQVHRRDEARRSGRSR